MPLSSAKVWLTGSGGMLASSIQYLLDQSRVEVIATTHQDVNVSSWPAVMRFAGEQRPTHIINCAAYTKVDDAETNRPLAYLTNTIGPGNLAAAAAEIGAHLLHFSTDYVFDGTGSEPYSEDEPTCPINEYGRSKRDGEARILEHAASSGRMQIVRTSWLFGEGGKNFVETMLRLMTERQTLGVVDDQRGCPTYTGDLAGAALELADLFPGGRSFAGSGIFHFVNHGIVSWYELACEIRSQALQLGFPILTEEINPIPTSEFPRPAVRPKYSALETLKIQSKLLRTPRHYTLALNEYLRRVAPLYGV